MNALRIVFQDIGLRNVPLKSDRRTLLVAGPADEWNTQRRNSRPGVGNRNDIMRAVTIDTPGGQCITSGCRFSVQGLRHVLLLGFMAASTLHLRQRHIVRKLFSLELGMASRAGE